MLKVIIPIAVLLILVLCKKIPVIGGKINIALCVTGALTLILGGIYNPGDWFAAWIDGLNRLSWIIALSITGSLFASISSRMGTIDTIMGALTAKFGNRPRALIFCILFVLVLAGSLLGDAIAASTVIGIMTIGILLSMNMEYEKISAIIVMGASIGSIMPPMTQALALSSSLANTPADPVIDLGYITVPIIFLAMSIYCCFVLVKKENRPGSNPAIAIKYTDKTASEILRKNWRSLVPLMVLILIVLLRTIEIPYVSVDLGPTILKNLTFLSLGDGSIISLYDFLKGATILNGLTNGIVLSIICAIAVSFLSPVVRKNGGSFVKEGFKNVKITVILQACCAFMLGSFYAAGSIDAVSSFAAGLNSNLLIVGGVVAMMLLGMITGSQSTTQNVVFSFFGPALIATGMNPTFAAVAGAHLAAAGQGLPPADLTTFVVAGIVSAETGKKVDPVKSMLYSVPMCICFLIVGIFFLYIK